MKQVLPDPNNMLAMMAMSRGGGGYVGGGGYGGGNPLAPPPAGPPDTYGGGGNALTFGADVGGGSGPYRNEAFQANLLYNMPDQPEAIAPEGRYANMSEGALAAWSKLLGVRPDLANYVTSTYRSPAANKAAGGARYSQHMHGNAFDMHIPGMSKEDTIALIQDAYGAGFKGIGVYGPGTLHFDVGGQRHWGPDYGSGSTPAWARPYLK